MAIYQQDNLKLEEAMTQPLQQKIRVWNVPGIHVNIDNVPENAGHTETSVMMEEGKIGVFLLWPDEVATFALSSDNSSADKATSMEQFSSLSLEELKKKFPQLFEKIILIERFTSLEELKKKFPQLFELEGTVVCY